MADCNCDSPEWFYVSSWALLLLALVFYIIQAAEMLIKSVTLGVSNAAYIYNAVLNIGWLVVGFYLQDPLLWVTSILYILFSLGIVLLKLAIEVKLSPLAQQNIEHIVCGLQTMSYFEQYKLAKGHKLFVAKEHKDMHHYEKGQLRYIFTFKDSKKRIHGCYLPNKEGRKTVQYAREGRTFDNAYLNQLKRRCCDFEANRNLLAPYKSTLHKDGSGAPNVTPCWTLCWKSLCCRKFSSEYFNDEDRNENNNNNENETYISTNAIPTDYSSSTKHSSKRSKAYPSPRVQEAIV